MKRLLLPLLLLSLTSCVGAPDEMDYCRSMGVEQGNPEFVSCTQYYFQQEAAFGGDRAVCDLDADLTYPRSLYSRPTSYPVRVYNPYGGFAHTEMVHVGADYQQIAQVDALRMRIIGPCMQARGWNSPLTWQAGRHTNAKVVKPKASQSLPWLK